MAAYTLVDYYDVWGNAEDGWEVNNSCEICNDIIVSDEASQDDIIEYLINSGYLKPDAKGKVEIDDTYIDMFDIVEKGTGMPIYGFRKNY